MRHKNDQWLKWRKSAGQITFHGATRRPSEGYDLGRLFLWKDIINKIVLEECGQDEELAKFIKDRARKSRSTVAIRRRILRRLRSEVWINSLSRGVLHHREHPGEGWKPLSFPRISEHLGGDHSSWVKMHKVIRQQDAQLLLNLTPADSGSPQ